MKPLQGKAKKAGPAATSVPVHISKDRFPVRLSASTKPTGEGFRASMTVSRSRITIHPAHSASGTPDAAAGPATPSGRPA